MISICGNEQTDCTEDAQMGDDAGMNIKYENPPKPPILFCEVDICFYLDFDMNKLNEIIGVNACEIRKMSEMRINPVTNKKNPGYWSYLTNKYCSFDCNLLFEEIDNLLSLHKKEFAHVLQQYKPSELLVHIWILVQQEGEFPIIRFSPQILSTLSSLGAILDINVSNDYISENKILNLADGCLQ